MRSTILAQIRRAWFADLMKIIESLNAIPDALEARYRLEPALKHELVRRLRHAAIDALVSARAAWRDLAEDDDDE